MLSEWAISALYEEGNPDDIADRALRDAFLFAQWRLAILARHRANAYDGQGNTALPYAERVLAILPDSPEIKRTVERIKAAKP